MADFTDSPAARQRMVTRLSAQTSAAEAGASPDWVTVEEPLEIRVEGRPVAVTMRTPGHDEELAAGFLLTEGVIRRRADLFDLTVCRAEEANGNVVDALASIGEAALESLTRHVFTSSSCGICGKASIESVFQHHEPLTADWKIPLELLLSLPTAMRDAQVTFAHTGGLHAAALFGRDGTLTALREDVGRHNAVDKLIGRALLDDALPLQNHILMVSGRLSFEIVQKALAAGIPFLAAVSAPSTLAVELAENAGITLVGFLRGQTANCYAHGWRIENIGTEKA